MHHTVLAYLYCASYLGRKLERARIILENIFIGRWRCLPDNERVLRVVLTSNMLATALAPRDWIKLLDISYNNKKTQMYHIEFILIYQKYNS